MPLMMVVENSNTFYDLYVPTTTSSTPCGREQKVVTRGLKKEKLIGAVSCTYGNLSPWVLQGPGKWVFSKMLKLMQLN